jgi:hypothetical protein
MAVQNGWQEPGVVLGTGVEDPYPKSPVLTSTITMTAKNTMSTRMIIIQPQRGCRCLENSRTSNQNIAASSAHSP